MSNTLSYGLLSQDTNYTPQTSAFYNMDHERVFHLVLITLGIPFVISATTSYILDFIQHDGEQFVEVFFVF